MNRNYLLMTMGALAVFAAQLLVPVTAFAQDNQYTLSQDTYKQVQRIQKMMGNNKYNKAIDLGKSILPRVKKESSYAEALVSQLIANSYLVQKEFSKAEPYLKTVVQLNALQPQNEMSVVQELATIYLVQKNYNGSIRLYQQVFEQAKKNKVQPSPILYYRYGLAYSYRADANNSKQDYEKALDNVKKAIDMRQKLHQKEPKKYDPVSKDWYQSWFVITYKMKDFHQAYDVAKLLVAKWPGDKDFWNYYANVALLLHHDSAAAAIYGLMYKKGFFKSKDDYLQLASLLLEEGSPYKAAEVIADGMKKGYIPKTKDNYEQLSGAWTSARAWDKALAALSKEAEVSKNGKVYLRQAAIYLNRRDYSKASQAVQNALNKGGLGDEQGRALMLLGQSEFELKNYDKAVSAFKKAEKYKKHEADARNWLKYVAQARNGG